MSQILIAAFDHYTEADQAKQALISQGIANGAIQLSASSNPATVDSEPMDIAAGKQQSQSVGDAVSAFFRSVFTDDADTGPYPEAMRRGSTLVTGVAKSVTFSGRCRDAGNCALPTSITIF